MHVVALKKIVLLMFNESVWKNVCIKLLTLTQLSARLLLASESGVLYETLRGCITNGHACEYLILVHITLQK